ncbi:MAG: class I SAM-dependent methyltransferase [Desulfurococcaceae archaeon]
MSDFDIMCWNKYGDLMENTVKWFRSIGCSYRSFPWRQEFLYKYSKGIGLDLGCGLASTTRELLKNKYLVKLILLDIVEETLVKICSYDHRIVCIRSDVLNIPFSNDLFDTVYLLAVLHHIPGVDCRLHVLREVYRVLKPCGYFILTVWNPILSVLLKNMDYIDYGDKNYLLVDKNGARYYYFYELDELVDQVMTCGFNIVESGFFIQNIDKPDITRNIYVVAIKSSK